jgi:hypothetical protein
MTQQNKPVMEIPVSDPMNVEKVRIKLLFDEPFEKEKESQFGDGTYMLYTYTILDMSDNTEKLMFAYTGLYNAISGTGAGKGAVLDIGRIGEGKSTVWGADYISGPRRPVKEESGAKVYDTAVEDKREWKDGGVAKTPARQDVFHPMSSTDVEIVMAIIEDDLNLLEQVVALVATKECFGDLSGDQQARVARGSLIEARRKHRPGMIVGSSRDDKGESSDSPNESPDSSVPFEPKVNGTEYAIKESERMAQYMKAIKAGMDKADNDPDKARAVLDGLIDATLFDTRNSMMSA